MSPDLIPADAFPTDGDLAVCKPCNDTGLLPDGSACEACPVAGDEWDALAFYAYCRELQMRDVA